MIKVPDIVLNTGNSIPGFGYGTWHLAEGLEAKDSTKKALEAGYRLVDTAKIYGNENSVGEAIRSSGLGREQVFITTKLWTRELGYDSAKRAFEDSLERLGLDYLDLYLIHWPGYDRELRKQAWLALNELYGAGNLKAAGVSNFEIEHLEDLMSDSRLIPAVNQIEFHPFNYSEQLPILDFCKENSIVVEAYSPLNRGRNIDNPVITDIANNYQKTNAQILLRWAIEHGTVPIPKSSIPERIVSNLKVFDFELEDKDIQKLDDLSKA